MPWGSKACTWENSTAVGREWQWDICSRNCIGKTCLVGVGINSFFHLTLSKILCRNGLWAYTSNQTTLLSEIRNLFAWDWKWEGAIASKKFKTSWKNLCHWIRLEKFKNKVYSKKLFEKYDPMAEIFADHWMLLHPLFAWDPNPEIRTHVHLMNTGHVAFSWLTWELLEPGIKIGD